MNLPLIEVRGVTKTYRQGAERIVVALEDFSLAIPEGAATIVAVAGESGSGKTTLARLILGFIEPTAGEILYRGKNVQSMSPAERLRFRREVQAIFQDPYEAYNPFYPVDYVFHTVIRKFRLAADEARAREMTVSALEAVGLRAGEILGKHPHQLSGGQRQRLMVARAFLLRPRLIVADEPVSMVDASLRATILETMLRLKEEFGVAFLYITHDLSTAYQISDRIVILYRGAVAEMGAVQAVIERPYHPYTQLLVNSIPLPDPRHRWTDRVEIPPEEELQLGAVAGCKFVRSCPHAMDACRQLPPPLYRVDDRQLAACFLYDDRPQAGEEDVAALVGPA